MTFRPLLSVAILLLAALPCAGQSPAEQPRAVDFQGEIVPLLSRYGCNTGGCHVDAKNSTAVSTIPKALATNRLKIVTRAHVTSKP